MGSVYSVTQVLTSAMGVPFDVLRDRSRHLRLDGLLPGGGTRGRGAAQLEVPALVTLMISALVGGPNAHSADATRKILRARFHETIGQTHAVLPGGAVQITQQIIASWRSMHPDQVAALDTFGAFIEALVEQATTLLGRAQLEADISDLSAWEDGLSAMLRTTDGRQIWFKAPLGNEPVRTPFASTQVRRMGTVPGRIIIILADLALEARQAARNTKARSAETLQADVIVSPRSLNSDRDPNNPEHSERESGGKARRGDIAKPEPPGIKSDVRELKSA